MNKYDFYIIPFLFHDFLSIVDVAQNCDNVNISSLEKPNFLLTIHWYQLVQSLCPVCLFLCL